MAFPSVARAHQQCANGKILQNSAADGWLWHAGDHDLRHLCCFRAAYCALRGGRDFDLIL